MADTISDALSLLPEFSWRGVVYPVTSESVNFRHDNAQNKQSFGSVTIIQPLGAMAFSFRYTHPMRNGLMTGPYKDMFQKSQSLASAMRDRSPGILISPGWGEFRCVPVSFEGATDIQRRDGIDATTEFIHAPDEEESFEFKGGASNIQALTSYNAAMDQRIKVLRDKYPAFPKFEQNPFDAITGMVRQIERNAQKVTAALHDFAYKCEKVERACDDMIKQTRSTDFYGLKTAARRNRVAALEAQKMVEGTGKLVVDMTVRSTIHVLTLAAEVGMTAKELLLLNPIIASNPRIPANSKLRIYKR